MDDELAYQARQKELLEGAHRLDWSLRNTFHSLLDEFEESFDSIFAGEMPSKTLLNRDVAMTMMTDYQSILTMSSKCWLQSFLSESLG